MDPVVLLLALAGSGVLAFRLWASRDRLRVWKLAAQECGLSDVRETRRLGFGSELTGRFGDLFVRLGRYSDMDGNERSVGTSVRIENRGPRRTGLMLRQSRSSRMVPPKSLRGELSLGDREFDLEFVVAGPPAPVRAVLDEETRRRLGLLGREAQLGVVNDEMHVRLPDRSFRHTLASTLPTLLDVAHRLCRPGDVVERLVDNARLDRFSGARLETLLTLLRHYPEDPRTREALAAACRDPSDEIRLQAGIALGAEGRALLLEIASRAIEDACAARAIAALGTALPRGQTQAILADSLRTRRLASAHACLEALGRLGGVEAVPPLSKVLAVEKGELAVTAAKALGWTDVPAAEGPLIAALGREQPELRAAAAKALGYVGTVDAVLPLKQMEERHLRDGAFRNAARQAVADIQSRLTDASAGQLSLSDDETGRLSLTRDESGRVSLAVADSPPSTATSKRTDPGRDREKGRS